MAKSNYCLIDPKGGSIKVLLSVDNGIRSGSLFVLWEKHNNEWKQKESFNLITGNDGVDDYILLEKPDEIENDGLAWNIQACAVIQGANSGEFKIEIHQDGKKIWNKISNRTVPYCNDGENILFGNEVIFKHLVINESNLRLWKQIER